MSEATLRLDKWLWFARFCKSRTQASALCVAGRVRVNGATVHKAHHPLRPGDVLTFAKGYEIRMIRVLALGARRGPATEAQTLYEEAEPPQRLPRDLALGHRAIAVRKRGSGRPTKAERRATDRFREPPT